MNSMLKLLVRDIRGSFLMSPLFLASMLVSPLIYIFVLGFAFSGFIPSIVLGRVSMSYVLFLAPGIIVSQFLTGGVYAGASIWFDRRFGMFEQILVGPFTKTQYIASKILSVALQGLAMAFLVLLLTSPLLSGLTVNALGVLFIVAAWMLGSLLFGSFSMVVTTAVKTDQVLNVVFNIIMPPLLFLSSIFYPLETVPAFIRALALVNPLTYAADMFRFGLLGLQTSYLGYEVLLLVIESAGMFLLATKSFKRIQM
ncbi:MAG: ABC transporter permease [Candidatus Bathyarchaeia archaeon]